MATKYNVYASGIDYDTDSSGDWVRADEHTEEVEALETEVSNLQSRIDDLEVRCVDLDDKNTDLIVENERLRKALQDILDS